MSAGDPGWPEEATDDELWGRITHLTGFARTDAAIMLAQRMYDRGDYSEAAVLQERTADLFIEDEHYDDAVIALARATGAWMEIDEWNNIELVAGRVRELEDKAFSAESWRDYYSAYAWSAHQRRASGVALEYIERALVCAEELGSNHGCAMLLFQKASVLATLGQSRQAIAIMEEALEEARNADSIPLIVDILAESALIEIQLLNAQRAIDLATEANTLAAEVYWRVLQHRAKYALGSAFLAAGRFDEAASVFSRIVDDGPNYHKIRTMIRLAECGGPEATTWESRAYVLARNTNTWDLLNHLEINRAMLAEPQLAIPVLDTVVARAIEYDDDVTRDGARLVLARKFTDMGDYRAAMDILNRMSTGNFGDDMVKAISYLVLRAECLIELGEAIEAAAISTTLTRLEPRREFTDGIAEGYWQLSIIELDANGPTREWQRLAQASVAFLAQGDNISLLRERATSLHGRVPTTEDGDARPIGSVDELLADIRREQDGLGAQEAA